MSLKKSGNGRIPFRERVKSKQPAWRLVLCGNIRNRRVELGLTQTDLGNEIGVVQQWIAQLEHPDGDEVPSLYQLDDLASSLRCKITDLLTPGMFDIGVSLNDDMRVYGWEMRTRRPRYVEFKSLSTRSLQKILAAWEPELGKSAQSVIKLKQRILDRKNAKKGNRNG